ncbi:MAG: beta-lactamase family protein, partial [Candidatus Mariimomonas ferrooxydans]
MDSKQKLFASLVFCLSMILVFGVTTQTAVANQAYTHNALTDKVDELFKQWDKNDSPGAAVGIFKDGRIIYARGYGIANLEYALPLP